MKDINHFVIPVPTLTLCLLAAAASAAGADNAKPAAVPPKGTPAVHATSSVEQQRNEIKQEGEKEIDKDAVAAVDEAQKALTAISKGKPQEAIAAMERVTGKIDILTARKPAAALVPVSQEVAIMDLAPTDPKAVQELSSAAQKALANNDYPEARILLEQLASEIHVRTNYLPLATYPAAMQHVAKLLDQDKTEEAKQALTAALNTLTVIDRSVPLPLVVAQAAIKDAQAQRDKDKPATRKLLATAKDELERAKNLGYANKDPEYASLNKSLTDLDTQLSSTQSTTSAFTQLREKMAAFFERTTKKPPNAQIAQK